MWVGKSLISVALTHTAKRTVGSNVVQKVEKVLKRTLWGYRGDHCVPFLKLTICDPKSLPRVRDEYLIQPCVTVYAYTLALYVSLNVQNVSSKVFSR
jgi:DNA polymerase delta subunit 1